MSAVSLRGRDLTKLYAKRAALLEACKEVTDWITDQFEDGLELDVVKHLKAAIALAESRKLEEQWTERNT